MDILNYDGLAGVIAGLICLIAQKRSGKASTTPSRVIGLRGEESAWFGKAYMGSGAIFGKLTPSDLETTHRSNGSTLASCIESTAVDVEAVRAQEKLFDVDNARAYLELQIEEGPVMVACKLMEMDDFIRGVHAMSAVFDRLCEEASCPRR
jgi:beta-ureidopropionase / N-carbamoyl-L-amino-acid hydrolase